MPDTELECAHIYCELRGEGPGRGFSLAEARSYLYSKCAFYKCNRWAKFKEVVC